MDLPKTPTKRHRTWSQRLILGFNCALILTCFGTAVGIYYANEIANDRTVISINSPAKKSAITLPKSDTGDPVTGQPVEDYTSNLVDFSARNFLITGSDNGACIDPDSPYNAAIGNRQGFGERADTIMILRIDPVSKATAVLSFPRDLWVRISGTKTKGRINTSFKRDDPNPLIATIYDNFGIIVDHYVNVDFCAFKKIVDAVGGVRVPFATPINDTLHTGLLIESAGCHTFHGDEGLAYVRSRHLLYYSAKKKTWIEDPASDRGRISRQQDFLRRSMQKALDKAGGSPAVIKDLIDTGRKYVILDDKLTTGQLLDLAIAMKNLDPATMKTYQVDGTGKMISGQSVIEPNLLSDNMKAVLAVFQGTARLIDTPEEIFVPVTTTSPASAPTTTLPPVYVESDVIGIVPTNDPSCR